MNPNTGETELKRSKEHITDVCNSVNREFLKRLSHKPVFLFTNPPFPRRVSFIPHDPELFVTEY